MKEVENIDRAERLCQLAAQAESRFWAKVDKSGPVPEHCPEIGPCWVWTGYISKSNKKQSGGYGVYTIGKGKGKSQENRSTNQTHRVSWMLTHGPIPNGQGVCHKCDNRACVRPDHLFLGDQFLNMQDAVMKGRTRHITHPETTFKGENHPRAKLSESNVREIRLRHLQGESSRSLSLRFGVTRGAINRIVQRKGWSHVA